MTKDELKKWLANLKVGDLVIAHDETGVIHFTCIIPENNKLCIYRYGASRFFSFKTGRSLGVKSLDPFTIQKPTRKEALDYKKRQELIMVTHTLGQFFRYDFSLKSLREINSLIKKKLKPLEKRKVKNNA